PSPTPPRPSTTPAATNESTYCAALNAARQNVCFSQHAATTTAATCTTTAGAHPNPSRIANVKHTEGNAGIESSRPTCTNVGVSATTANAPKSQNTGGI